MKIKGNVALWFYASGLALLLIGFPKAYCNNIEDKTYCEMVKIYESDNNQNLSHRNGWPNYKHVDCGGH